MPTLLELLPYGPWVLAVVTGYPLWRWLLKPLLLTFLKHELEMQKTEMQNDYDSKKTLFLNEADIKKQEILNEYDVKKSEFMTDADLKKQEIAHTLGVLRDVAQTQAEFEKVKLVRVLPMLEKLNGAIYNHYMIFNSFKYYVRNKLNDEDKRLETHRLEQDTLFIETMSQVAIYLPPEFTNVILKIRKLISCSIRNPVKTRSVLVNIGGLSSTMKAASVVYSELMDCFDSMCRKYILPKKSDLSYSQLLKKFNLDTKANTLRVDPLSNLAEKFILFHEYYGSNDVMAAQEEVEEYMKLSTPMDSSSNSRLESLSDTDVQEMIDSLRKSQNDT